MDSAHPKDSKNLLSLKEAAEKLSVPPEILLNWNEHNILKPTITLNGEIGYTNQQIENFLLIRQIPSNQEPLDLSNISSDKAQIPIIPVTNSHSEPVKRVNSTLHQPEFKPTQDSMINKKDKNKSTGFRYFLAVSSLSFVFFSLSFAFLANHPDANLASKSNQDLSAETQETSSKDSKTQTVIASDSYNLEAPNSKDKNQKTSSLTDENLNSDSKKLVAVNGIFDSKLGQNVPKNANDKNFEVLASESKTNANIQMPQSDTTNFNPVNDSSDDKDSVFDSKGNLKGKAPDSNLLGSASVGTTALSGSITDQKQTISPILAILFLGFGVSAIIYTSKFPLSFLVDNLGDSKTSTATLPSLEVEAKVMELNQKTDGSVVILFKGREYKISKPELDSESDQFITRIMELMQNGQKEIDYDILQDEKIRFTTPLSKLVTRLGFVGIKRDLFFPRTSKTKVFFRKYLTEDDLNSMSLATDQISPNLE